MKCKNLPRAVAGSARSASTRWTKSTRPSSGRSSKTPSPASTSSPRRRRSARKTSCPGRCSARSGTSSRKGFPPGKTVAWDAEVLEELCEMLQQVAPGGQFLWNNQQLVHFMVPQQREPWATIHTKKPHALLLHLTGPKGKFGLGRLLGARRRPRSGRHPPRPRHRAAAVRRRGPPAPRRPGEVPERAPGVAAQRQVTFSVDADSGTAQSPLPGLRAPAIHPGDCRLTSSSLVWLRDSCRGCCSFLCWDSPSFRAAPVHRSRPRSLGRCWA